MGQLDEIVNRWREELSDLDPTGLGITRQGRVIFFADSFGHQLGGRPVLTMPPVARTAAGFNVGISSCHETLRSPRSPPDRQEMTCRYTIPITQYQ